MLPEINIVHPIEAAHGKYLLRIVGIRTSNGLIDIEYTINTPRGEVYHSKRLKLSEESLPKLVSDIENTVAVSLQVFFPGKTATKDRLPYWKELVFVYLIFFSAFALGMLFERDSLYDLEGIVQADGQSYPAVHVGEYDKLGVEGKPFVAPNLSELVDFLESDKTNEIKYNNESFNCVQFSESLMDGMKEKGWAACQTHITFVNQTIGHAIVAVLTTDGVFYVEPQNDRLTYRIDLGEEYWKQVGGGGFGVGKDLIVKGVYSCFVWSELETLK